MALRHGPSGPWDMWRAAANRTYMARLPGVSGLVVAGGASSRLGMDKRAVRLGGTTLLARAASLLWALSDDVMIAGPSGGGPVGLAPSALDPPGLDQDARDPHVADARVRLVRDPVPDRGAMAGILAGLRHARNMRLVVIPVDMPLLTAPFLRFLAERDPEAAVTVPRWHAGLEPLVAVYHRSCAEEVAGRVDRGTTALHAFITATSLPVRVVDEPEIRAYGEPARLFLNINTPDDLTTAERLLGEPPAPRGRP